MALEVYIDGSRSEVQMMMGLEKVDKQGVNAGLGSTTKVSLHRRGFKSAAVQRPSMLLGRRAHQTGKSLRLVQHEKMNCSPGMYWSPNQSATCAACWWL
jgi:hypothetical protein